MYVSSSSRLITLFERLRTNALCIPGAADAQWRDFRKATFLGKTKRYPRISNNRPFRFWRFLVSSSSSKEPGSKGAKGKEACSDTFQRLMQNNSVAVMTHALK